MEADQDWLIHHYMDILHQKYSKMEGVVTLHFWPSLRISPTLSSKWKILQWNIQVGYLGLDFPINEFGVNDSSMSELAFHLFFLEITCLLKLDQSQVVPHHILYHADFL